MVGRSLPSRERGLKSYSKDKKFVLDSVAPLAGAWIEIVEAVATMWGYVVAPLAGAWIEIRLAVWLLAGCTVAPLAGAWIEILLPWTLIRSEGTSLPSRERGLK